MQSPLAAARLPLQSLGRRPSSGRYSLFSGPPRLNPPGWSLEIEVQFYVMAPALILAYLALRHQPAHLLLGLAIIAGSTLLWLWLANTHGECGQFGWTLLNHFPVFMSALLLLLTGIFLHSAGWLEHLAIDAATLASLVGLYCGATRGRFAHRLLGLRALIVIGTACYAIYLTHVPLMHFTGQLLFKLVKGEGYLPAWGLGMLVLLPLSLVAGMIFHVLTEKPFVHLATSRSVPGVRPSMRVRL